MRERLQPLGAAPSVPDDAPRTPRGEPTLRLDADGRIVAASPAADALLGTGASTGRPPLAGRDLASLVVDGDRAQLGALIATIGPGADPSRAELQLVSDAGRRLTVTLLLAPFPVVGADGAAALGYLHDVSGPTLAERLRAADAAVIDAFAAGESPAQAARRLLHALADVLAVTRASCLTRDPGGELEPVAVWPEVPAPTPRTALAHAQADAAADAALAARAIETGRLVTRADPPPAPSAAVAVPLGRDLAPRSAVVLTLADAVAPDPTTLDVLAEVGARVGELLAILRERHSRIESLVRLALTDELTGLPNRRAWEEMLSRELARAARDRQPVCVAVLDLDGFKAFNDAHGHQAGDELLRQAAIAWQRQLRLSDVLARYGGEEFAAVIPAWPLQTAIAVIERVRAATPGGLTASAGVASWTGEETGDELFGRADAALYAAKQAGRDRTVAAASDDVSEATWGAALRARGSRPRAS